MRKAWTHTFAVALCVAGLTASLAVADPASWAMKPRPGAETSSSSFWPWSRNTAAATPRQFVPGESHEKVSPLRHPIQYLQNATSSQGKAASSQHATMPPAS